MDVPTSHLVPRGVEIRPPSARAETWNVLRVAALIVLATWIYLADTAGPGAAFWSDPDGGAAGAGQVVRGATRDLMPYQRLFGTLGGQDQRLFRELQEGLLEAENSRSSNRHWPAPAALAARGIPPFAEAPGPHRGRYRWELRQEGLVVNYLGVPAGGRAPAFLLLVQEPDPQAPLDAAAPPVNTPSDEFHHRLADGTVLHVSTWMTSGAVPGPAAGLIAAPYAQGWTQLLVGGARP